MKANADFGTVVNKQPPTLPGHPSEQARRQSSKADILREKGGVTVLIDRDLKETQLADGQMALLIKC